MSRRGRRLLGAAATLLAAELLVRLAEPRATGSLYGLIVPHASRFRLRPSTTLVAPERYGDVEYRINRDGYRDVDHSLEGTRTRAVVLGDSVAFGLGVPVEKTFPAHLAGELVDDQGRPAEVLNLAVFAYDTEDELAAFREDGARYGPRLVLIQLFLNDLTEKAPGPAAPRPFGQRLAAARNTWLNRSALYRRAQQALLGLAYLALHDLRRERYPDSLNDAEPRSKAAYLLAHSHDDDVAAFRALRALHREVERSGATLVLVVSPDEAQLEHVAWDDVQGRIVRFAASEGIATLDLLPPLRASPRRRHLFLDGVHYTAEGHRAVADLILRFLRERRLPAARPRSDVTP